MSDTLRLKAIQRPQRNLLILLRRRLFISIALCVFFLLLSSAVGIYVSWSQQQLGEQKVALHDDVNGLLQSMVDQETGLRGYIATNDETFLAPLNSGQTNYTLYLQRLKSTANVSDFHATISALSHVEDRATAWIADFEDPQIAHMQAGNTALARSNQVNTQGKALFDAFRSSISSLQSASDTDLAALQNSKNLLDLTLLTVVLALMAIVIIYLWNSFRSYTEIQRLHLSNLQAATEAFGKGDLSVRVEDGRDSQFNEVGQTFNQMADILQEQQAVLKDRDILEQVRQLNTLLTESLDLEDMMQKFFQRMLNLLNVQIIALYLYDADKKNLTLFASRGIPEQGRQTTFSLGEGLIGQVAQDHQPLLLTTQDQGGNGFTIKTVLGEVIPSSLYDLPLMQSNELLGVLAVGSVLPMTERTRNVLEVISSNLAAAIRNTQTYEHSQHQTQELADYAHQQEISNRALRQQRDELTILNSALEEANRVRSQFLSTMSHELRTPLTSIIGFSQMIMRSTKKSPITTKQSENIDRILKNAQHLLSLINDVLDIAKVEAGHMDVNATEVNVDELITSVVDETRSIAIDRKLTLKHSVEEGITTIESDPRKLRQILLNLVSNALKFTERGSVTVTAILQHASDREDRKGGQIAISVQDTGIGITRNKQEHIFEAFYQVDNSNSRTYGGTGLGLSIVRELTTLLGGKVEIQSEEGKGSTFTIVLPLRIYDQRSVQDLRLNTLHDQTSVPYQAHSRAAVAEDADREPVLIGDTAADTESHLIIAVDDNPDVLQLIAASLEQTSYRVIGIQDPTKAVEVIQELQPSAITLDIMMPKVNGWQILHQLKSNPATASIPVILLTVLEDRSAGYVLGADEYLVKPVAREALLSVLQQLITYKPVAIIDAAEGDPEKTTGNQSGKSGQVIMADLSKQRDETDGVVKPVLLVHNEPNIHLLMDKLIRQTGYVLQKASAEQELFDTIEKAHPDLLMMLINADDGKFLEEQIKVVVEQNTHQLPPLLTGGDGEPPAPEGVSGS